MRFIHALAPLMIIAGCGTTITSIPQSADGAAGTPYTLPRGLVPVRVFADENGVGITIEPAKTVIDSEAGTLVAKYTPNPFNNEDLKLATDPGTGFLKTITTDSDAQLLAIVEEAAKSVGRLALQNSRAAFLKTRVVVLDDSFDPLTKTDVERINRGVNHAVARAAAAFLGAQRERITLTSVKLSVVNPDGSDPFQSTGWAAADGQRPALQTTGCAVGICVRTLTSRIVRIEVDGQPFASKAVSIPARELIPLPLPSTAFADQDVNVEIQDGIVARNDLKRESEILGVAKLPGAALNGLVAGITQGLTERKSIIDKRKDLAASEQSYAEAVESRKKTTVSQGTTSLDLQNATAEGATAADYAATTLTVYPFSETLTNALEQAIEAARVAREAGRLNEDSINADLLSHSGETDIRAGGSSDGLTD